ncbi:hypothetical protein N7528_003832 [Penicillium herquei]|nr:hypothetical protein N7528_003832 [Penicillium herquei]
MSNDQKEADAAEKKREEERKKRRMQIEAAEKKRKAEMKKLKIERTRLHTAYLREASKVRLRPLGATLLTTKRLKSSGRIKPRI